MKPYFEDGGIQIFHGDCREVLPGMQACPESLITDPVWPNASVALAGSDAPHLTLRWMFDALPSDPKRIALHLGCDTDPRFNENVPPRFDFFRVCWLEIARVGYKGRLLMTGDVAYLFGEPPPSVAGARVIPGRMIDPSCNGQQNAHPCPRKLAHVEWLVRWWSAVNETVLDPFCGSGTTLHAAKNMGRKAIGIEIEERYCEIAAKRLCQGVLNLGAA